MKKNLDLVSVIINCYNGEKYLKKAVDSVLSQTYKKIEIIFWDNRSIDKSKKIIKNYNDKRIKYFLAKKHTNLHKARNLAIEKTRGTFICFLDSDDYWSKRKIELQVKTLNKKKLNIAYGNCWLENQQTLSKKKIFSKSNLPEGNILSNILKEYCIFLSTIMIRKQAFKKTKFKFDERYKIISDFDLCVRLSNIWEFACVQEPIATYRIHGKNFFIKNKLLQIRELENWYNNAKNLRYGKNIGFHNNLRYIKKKN